MRRVNVMIKPLSQQKKEQDGYRPPFVMIDDTFEHLSDDAKGYISSCTCNQPVKCTGDWDEQLNMFMETTIKPMAADISQRLSSRLFEGSGTNDQTGEA